jgi:hypothetical protein
MKNILGTLFIFFCIGKNFTIGAFSPYYLSYIKYRNPEINIENGHAFGMLAFLAAGLAVISIKISKNF